MIACFFALSPLLFRLLICGGDVCDDQSRSEIEVRGVERIFFLVNNPKHHVELAHVKIKSCPQMKDGNRNSFSSRGTHNVARGGGGNGQFRSKEGAKGGGRKVSSPRSSQKKEGRWAKPEWRGKGPSSPHRGQQRYQKKEGERGMASRQEQGKNIRRNRAEPMGKRISNGRKEGERRREKGSEDAAVHASSGHARSVEGRLEKSLTPRRKGPYRGRQVGKSWESSEFPRRPPPRRGRVGAGAPPRIQRKGEGSNSSSIRREKGSEDAAVHASSGHARSVEGRLEKSLTPRRKGPYRSRQVEKSWESSEFPRRPPPRRGRVEAGKRSRSVPRKAYEEIEEGAPPRIQRKGEGSDSSSMRRDREGKGRTSSSRAPSRVKGVKQRKTWSKKRIGVQSLLEGGQRPQNKGRSNGRSDLSEEETSKGPAPSQRGKKRGGTRARSPSVHSQSKRAGRSQGGAKGSRGNGKGRRVSTRDF